MTVYTPGSTGYTSADRNSRRTSAAGPSVNAPSVRVEFDPLDERPEEKHARDHAHNHADENPHHTVPCSLARPGFKTSPLPHFSLAHSGAGVFTAPVMISFSSASLVRTSDLMSSMRPLKVVMVASDGISPSRSRA